MVAIQMLILSCIFQFHKILMSFEADYLQDKFILENPHLIECVLAEHS